MTIQQIHSENSAVSHEQNWWRKCWLILRNFDHRWRCFDGYLFCLHVFYQHAQQKHRGDKIMQCRACGSFLPRITLDKKSLFWYTCMTLTLIVSCVLCILLFFFGTQSPTAHRVDFLWRYHSFLHSAADKTQAAWRVSSWPKTKLLQKKMCVFL